jgi:hypothetical protein
MQRLVEQLQQDPALLEHLPSMSREAVQAALKGQSVYEIAASQGMSEAAVWDLLSNAARVATGQGIAQSTETGGFGSDTDPGVTGGYGATGFGDIGNEGPEPITEEPEEK